MYYLKLSLEQVLDGPRLVSYMGAGQLRLVPYHADMLLYGGRKKASGYCTGICLLHTMLRTRQSHVSISDVQ